MQENNEPTEIVSVHTETIAEDELPDRIRQLSLNQQNVLRLLAVNPSASISELARKASLSPDTINTWLYHRADPFGPVFKQVKALSIKTLPAMVIAMATEASVTAMERDIEASTAPNPDTAAMLTAVGHRRDTIYKAAGLLKDATIAADSITLINTAIVNYNKDGRHPEPWDVAGS